MSVQQLFLHKFLFNHHTDWLQTTTLAQSWSHCSVIIIPAMLALNASTPYFHWEYSLIWDGGWKHAGIPQGLGDLSKLLWELPLRQPTPPTPPYSKHTHIQKKKKNTNQTPLSAFCSLPSTWLKSHHPQTKVKKRGREREVGVEGGENGSYLWVSLSSMGCRNSSSGGSGKSSSEQQTWESERMWMRLRGCVITSHDMFPPLPV